MLNLKISIIQLEEKKIITNWEIRDIIKEIYEIKSGKRNADIYKLFDAQTEFNNGFGN